MRTKDAKQNTLLNILCIVYMRLNDAILSFNCGFRGQTFSDVCKVNIKIHSIKSRIKSRSVRNRPTRTLEVSLSTETTHTGYFASNSMHFLFKVQNPLCIIHVQNVVLTPW